MNPECPDSNPPRHSVAAEVLLEKSQTRKKTKRKNDGKEDADDG
jgi:hypothetical protein